jgi:hypothetical protein
MDMMFLTQDDVLIIHADMILRYGGMPGVRIVKISDSQYTVRRD